MPKDFPGTEPKMDTKTLSGTRFGLVSSMEAAWKIIIITGFTNKKKWRELLG
ncbi:MAG: hypothetical protein GXY81_08045 [Candidatus Cloacimonetes bacterium]|nr:hypothetical protein [Candidatus Cloacimonadota bacterium]